MIPPSGVDARNFTLNYDVVLHQVVTHKVLVSIRNDWENGVNAESPVEAGVLAVDNKTGKALPIEINLEKGNWFSGFKSMVALGMRHIKEGTDHLLFLLVLLLPATLLLSGKSWGEFGGTKYSVARLLKIVTAFTVGHSVTLLIGALNLFQMPQQPVEVLIAVSILVSAVHAVRPIFLGKEMYVAAGFGLIHGLAFATVLADLNLDATRMALSILGFNIGIEMMQIFVIALIVPWFILIAQTKIYKPVRIVGALLSSVAAIAWIAERVSGDGKADIAFFRPSTGTWYVLRSNDSSYYGFQFGASGDIPASGDYDGDGKYDAAVFRPSNSAWYLNRSTSGSLAVQFGTTGDQPIPNAFVR